MKPDEKACVLSKNPDVKPADLAEYERLLSERFATDPDVPADQLDAMAPSCAGDDASSNS